MSPNENIIEKAKDYAESNNNTLSKLIAYDLAYLTKKEKDEQLTPLVKSLSGVITIDDDFDAKDEYTQYLIEKYN